MKEKIIIFFFFIFFIYLFFFFKQKTAYEITVWLEFRRVLFRSTLQIRAILYASRIFVKYSSSIVIYCKDVDGKLEKSRANTYHTHPCLFAVLDTWSTLLVCQNRWIETRTKLKVGLLQEVLLATLKNDTCKLANYNNYAIVSNRYSLSRQNAWMRRKTWSKP